MSSSHTCSDSILYLVVTPVVTIVLPDPSYAIMVGELVSFQCAAVVSFMRNYTVNIQDNITFECVAMGIPPPLTITWYRNGTELNNTTDLRVTSSEPSDSMVVMDSNGELVFAVSRTLTIAISEDNDSGYYECRASNEAIPGEGSTEFELTVQSKLNF